MSIEHSPAQPHLGLVSPCGWGNLGDAAIQEAMILNIRQRIPDAQIHGITLNPEDTTTRHGIPAFPIGSHARPGRWIRHPESTGGSPVPESAPAVSVRSFLKRVPLLKSLVQRVRSLTGPASTELRHIQGALKLARSLDLLVVSGGGQLDDQWGGPWGGPYDLWKWCVLADAVGARVAIASVGAEALSSSTSRTLVRGALGLAAYRSYRDEASKRVVQGLGLGWDDPVVPDLAFSLPVSVASAPGRMPPTVGLSPIAYCDPRAWPRKDATVYRTYLNMLAGVARSLRERGHRILLFATDSPDVRTIEDLRSLAPDLELAVPPGGSLAHLFQTLADVDLVIASRLHGVLLSLLAGRPVLALSYHHKVRDHMEGMRLARHCLDLEGATPAAVVSHFDDLVRNAKALGPAIAAQIDARRCALARQYDQILATFTDATWPRP